MSHTRLGVVDVGQLQFGLHVAQHIMSKPGTLTTVVNLSKFSFGSFSRRFVCGLILLGAVFARADYPLVSHKYAADPAAVEFNGRLYLCCSNDDENGTNGRHLKPATAWRVTVESWLRCQGLITIRQNQKTNVSTPLPICWSHN